MDSPENDKTTTATLPPSDAVATQERFLSEILKLNQVHSSVHKLFGDHEDSGIFSCINNLSPVQPLKAAPEVPGFSGLDSPPPVFTSPHPKADRETNCLERPKCLQLPTADLSQQGARGNKIDVHSDQYQIPKTQGSWVLVPCNKKERDSKGSSPSGVIDEYLAPMADPMEVDLTHTAHLASLSSMQSKDMPRSLTDCAESISLGRKLDHEHNTGQIADKELGAFQATLEQAMHELQGKSSFEDNPVKTYKQGDCEMPPIVCPKVESDLEEHHCGPSQSQHCGTHRRCLQFGESQLDTMENGPGFWSPNIGSSPNLPANPGGSDVESSCLEVRANSFGEQLNSSNQPTVPISSSRNSGNSSSAVPKPSGIGLHLNSIINAVPYGSGTTGSMKSSEKGYLNKEGRKLVSITGRHKPEITTNTSGLSNVRAKASASSEDGSCQNESSVATGSLASLSPHILKPLYVPVLLEPCDYQRTSSDKRRSISEHTDVDEESNPSSTKKKRKKASAANDGDGCKRCNCKKTKCLKLYCDCFAAGIYCAGPCACQGCYNRPEYEDTVLETRQQIESRNPLAFAPKIVQRITESPADSNVEDRNASTPSSARHKRGCNCKKSMCLKKYCECYQANVGCSNGCRCEGCKNLYGRKGDYGMTEDVLSKEPESSFEEKLEMFASQDGLLQTELCNPHNMTPLTPSFQFSDHRKDAPKSRFSSRRCLPSPESNHTFLTRYGKSPVSENSHRHDLLLKDRKNVEDISSRQELDYRNVEAEDEFSLRYDGLLNSCDLSTLPNPPSSVNSVCWHNAAITPVTQYSGTQLILALDSDEKFHDVLEDDMPDILKDDSTPLKVVKVSSPNKKRVSPPHSSLKEPGSTSSAGLRSGRKFILQAVPSFPPLTPCIDSKDGRRQTIDCPQDCSGN